MKKRKPPLKHLSIHLCRKPPGLARTLCDRLVREENLVPSDFVGSLEISCEQCNSVAGHYYDGATGGIVKTRIDVWKGCCSKKGVSAPEFERIVAHRDRVENILRLAHDVWSVGNIGLRRADRAIGALSAEDRRHLRHGLRLIGRLSRQETAAEKKAQALYFSIREYGLRLAAQEQAQ